MCPLRSRHGARRQCRDHAVLECQERRFGMKRLICMAVFGLIVSAGAALAQGPTHPSGALGFHSTEAPIGIRWWLSGQKIALDAGVGFGSHDEAGTSLSNWALDIGLPIALKTWDRVHFMVR